MERDEMWKFGGGLATLAVLSWFFSWEMLFLMSIFLTLSVALVFAGILGVMMITEKLMGVEREEKGWAQVQGSASRSLP